MDLETESLLAQIRRWPDTGRVIVAQFDAESIIVYQSYRPSIGQFATAQGFFDGALGFSKSRMTWIKTNFLWMMYRSGWGVKADQEVTLAIRLARSAFDRMLAQSVPSHFEPRLYPSEEEWKRWPSPRSGCNGTLIMAPPASRLHVAQSSLVYAAIVPLAMHAIGLSGSKTFQRSWLPSANTLSPASSISS